MADPTAYSQARQNDIGHILDQQKALQQQAAAEREAKGDVKGCAEKLSLVQSQELYHQAICFHAELKDYELFAAECRYYVTAFQHLAYMELMAMPQAREPQAASQVDSVESVLSLLDALELEEGDDDDARAFVQKYEWLKVAWKAAVQRTGLSLSDYEALLEFKEEDDGSIFIGAGDDVDDPEHVLRVLESGAVPVEAKLQPYMQPLIRLMKYMAE